jgi:hypothetical protein
VVVVRVERLVAKFPRLYHMAQDGSWPSISAHGLLSTSALLDLYGVHGEERATESAWRPGSVTLSHPSLGPAVIRDQRPLRPALLARCLTEGMTPAQWYGLLNARVFFWVSEDNLRVLRNAVAYRDAPQSILVVDTARLTERYLDEIQLSSINSGSILRGGAARGPRTFRSVEEHDSLRVVELAVLGAVPDITDVVLRVERWLPDGTRTLIWGGSTMACA